MPAHFEALRNQSKQYKSRNSHCLEWYTNSAEFSTARKRIVIRPRSPIRVCRHNQKVPRSDKVNHVVRIGHPVKERNKRDCIAVSNLTSRTINNHIRMENQPIDPIETFLERSLYIGIIPAIWYIQVPTQNSAQCTIHSHEDKLDQTQAFPLLNFPPENTRSQ